MEFPEPIVFSNDGENNFLSEMEKILSWSKSNPDKDYLCGIIKNDRCFDNEYLSPKIEEKYFAGSVALRHFIKYISCVTNTRYLDWSPNNTNIFILNKYPLKICVTSDVNIIHTPYTSIELLLTSFDLPICRVAMDFNQNIYFTAQALFSVIKGYMNLPSYIRNIDNWKEFSRNKDFHVDINKIYNNYHVRLDKYWARGFRPKWFECDMVQKWTYYQKLYI